MSDLVFKTNFINLPEESGPAEEIYDYASNVRNVVFVLSDGNELMRNYAYLVGVDLLKEGEKNILEIHFTSDTILIEGYQLRLLRDQFHGHIPKNIIVTSSRYFDERTGYCITGICKK